MNDGQKVALVTGASRGIGKAIALQLGQDGFTVVGTATSQAGADAISGYMQAHDLKGQGLVLDVGSDTSVDEALSLIESSYAQPLVVVNNAGITRDNLLMRMKADEWDDVINTNLNAMFRVCKATVKAMTRARWGRIVNISSVVGASGNPGQTNYAASKAGIEGFSRALAKEVGSRGITVNVVAPGFIATDMTSALPEKQKEALLSQIPLGRLGEAEEIASCRRISGLGTGPDTLTGETLHVNGGMYMT